MNQQPSHPPQAGLLPLDKLIKASQALTLVCLTAEEKQKYHVGIAGLWAVMERHPPNHPERLAVHRKLTEVSRQLQVRLAKWNQEAAQAQAANLAAQMARQASQQQHAMTQGEPTASSQRPPEQLTEEVKTQARNLQLALPPQLWSASPEEKNAWLSNEKRSWATCVQKREAKMRERAEYSNAITNRQKSGKPLTPEESQKIKARVQGVTNAISECNQWLSNFNETQKKLREHLAAAGHALPGGANGRSDGAPGVATAPGPPRGTGSNEKASQGSQANQEEGRGSAVAVERHPVEPSQHQAELPNPSSASQLPATATAATSAPAGHPNTAAASALVPAAHSSPPTAPASASPVHLHNPKASGQQATLAATQERSWSSQPHPPPTSLSGTTPNLNMSRDATANRWTRPIVATPLVPVAMGPARPTYSGGPSTGAMGPLGQPGIQQLPGFVLEGEGERVLSKKKLEELVRQVTGGTETEGAEMLDPEVEETLLDLADEFVDNVLTAACRLSKLRNSTQLEVRDIQIILERNYNIRVPGFASDELRTVKKIQPTQTWAQKVSAVQAAKVTGGRMEL